jgi:energy-coupling factor transport system ATP-binding protein
MNDMIETRDLRFSYPNGEGQPSVPALQSVDVRIEKGSFTVILGRNGSGKSTFAKTLNAILLPQAGQVLVCGLDTKDESHLLDIRRRVGMVFQNPDNQIVSNVVEEDVAFAPENLGAATEEIRRRVDESLASVGLSDFAQHAPHLLSGGQKQRLAIAGVIAMEPDCIVLDESTAMLDPMGRREVLSTVQRLNQEKGITVILITHHMNEAQDAQRVVVMDEGRIVLDGTPKEVFVQVDTLRRLGLTVPDTVDLLHRLHWDGISLPLDNLSVEECAGAIARAWESVNQKQEQKRKV